MQNTTYGLGPLLADIRDEFRHTRSRRAERKSLRRELASYSTPSDLADLEATVARYPEDQTTALRELITTRRMAA